MKYTFIGDIHGKNHEVEAALALDGKKIFVGDFIDSFDRTVDEHRKCYELVFEAIRKGEAEALFGNHELSYLMPNPHYCSGHNKEREALIQEFDLELRSLFKPYLLLQPDLLISHAGLDKEIWINRSLNLENLSQALAEWWPDIRSPMHWVGASRGGFQPIGGLFWCDFNREFEPILELRQIFGHTRGKGIRQRGNAYCIDCLDLDRSLFLTLEI